MNIDTIRQNLGANAWIVEVKKEGTDFDVVQAQVTEVRYRYNRPDMVIGVVEVIIQDDSAPYTRKRVLKVRPNLVFANKTAAIDFAETKVNERNAALLARIAELRAE